MRVIPKLYSIALAIVGVACGTSLVSSRALAQGPQYVLQPATIAQPAPAPARPGYAQPVAPGYAPPRTGYVYIAKPAAPPAEELRTCNFQVSPIALATRHYNLAVDFGVSDTFALGPKLTYFRDGTLAVVNASKGYQLGLRGSWYLDSDRFQSGPLLRPAIYYGSWTEHDTLFDSTVGRTPDNRYFKPESPRDRIVNGPVAETMLAYQFVGRSGVNLDGGIGVTAYGVRLDTTGGGTEDAFVRFSPLLEINLGYAF